jgi:small-conductance mechanosensitive channel
MLLSGAIGIILSGVIIYSVYKLILTIVNLVFYNSYIKKSYIIRNRDSEIKKGIGNILSLVFFIYWVNISLNGFGIKDEIIKQFQFFFTQQYSIGNMSFGINNIVYFFFAIYASIWLSRFILIILNEEVFVRRHTDKGVSGTITLLLRYSILTIGFFFALAVAGINLENISIVIGALGVGIGFGLQDIFNNLISGIILAIERPIKVDDIIQVGELTGVVKDIGFRSSKIKTYDGSEVIVPNGQIVSNQMINWTLSDRKRRLKINLGVSYDSDPEEVIDILKEITASHPNVETNPAPRPRFLGFGDSTLDFQLLFWISDFDNSFGMGTEITIELYKKLKERGIKIPYPKQDITITNITNKKEEE